MKKFWISIFMFVCLALATLGTSPVAALSASGPVGNQVFYSPFIGSLINPVLSSDPPTRLFYSLYIESLIPGGTRDLPDPVLSSDPPTRLFYSLYIGSLIPDGTRDFPDPVLSSNSPTRPFYFRHTGSLIPGNRSDFLN